MKSPIQKAADAAANAKGSFLTEEAFGQLASVASQELPKPQANRSWEVSARYRVVDDVWRIITRVVMAGTEQAAKAKVARDLSIPEASIRSVHEIDGIARFAHSASELVESAWLNGPGYYDVDPVLLRQTKAL